MLKGISFIALMLVLVIPAVQSAPGPAVGDCEIYRHQAVVAVALVVAAGDNEVWSSQPGCGIARSNTQAFIWSGTFSGPLLLALPTLTWVSGGFVGCTLSTILVQTATVAAFSSSTAVASLTMTANECRGYITFTATLAPLYLYTTVLPINIRVEQTMPSFPTTLNVVNSGTITNPSCLTVNNCAFSVVNSGGQTISISSWPTLLATLSGGITITDDANGWIIHQDPLSGTVNVVNSGGQNIAITSWPELLATLGGGLTICPPTAPCYVVSNGTVSINGNVSTNQTNLPPAQEPGFDGSLYILLVIFAGVVAWFGETRKDNIYRMIAGGIMVLAAFVSLWELDRLGFNNVDSGITFALGFMMIELPLGLYLLIPKKWEETTQ